MHESLIKAFVPITGTRDKKRQKIENKEQNVVSSDKFRDRTLNLITEQRSTWRRRNEEESNKRSVPISARHLFWGNFTSNTGDKAVAKTTHKQASVRRLTQAGELISFYILSAEYNKHGKKTFASQTPGTNNSSSFINSFLTHVSLMLLTFSHIENLRLTLFSSLLTCPYTFTHMARCQHFTYKGLCPNLL